MFRQLLVGLVASSLSFQAIAQAGAFNPAVGAQFSFGGPEQSSSFKAHLSFSLPVVSEVAGNQLPQQIQKVNYLSFASSHNEGSVLHFLGTPVAAWSQPKHSEFMLHQNQQSSSWLSRNWWLVGLGVLAVGAAAANGGGGGADEPDTNQNQGCTVVGNGDVVGPRPPPTVNPNCV